jgi:hypothetical protein
MEKADRVFSTVVFVDLQPISASTHPIMSNFFIIGSALFIFKINVIWSNIK